MASISRIGFKNFEDARRWHETVREINTILDGVEYDKWTIADKLVELIPDGDVEINAKLNRFSNETGGRLAKCTLTKYRRAALRFPSHLRGDNKPFWYYAQASHHPKAAEIVRKANTEFELREMLGGRDPYRVKNSRVQDALKKINVVHDLFTPALIHLWLNDREIRQRFVDELRASHGYCDISDTDDI